MIPRNDCPDGPTRQESLAAVRSATAAVTAARNALESLLDDYIDAVEAHDINEEFDFFTLYSPVTRGERELHKASIALLDAKAEAAEYGHMSDEAEMDEAADKCEISRLGRG